MARRACAFALRPAYPKKTLENDLVCSPAASKRLFYHATLSNQGIRIDIGVVISRSRLSKARRASLEHRAFMWVRRAAAGAGAGVKVEARAKARAAARARAPARECRR